MQLIKCEKNIQHLTDQLENSSKNYEIVFDDFEKASKEIKAYDSQLKKEKKVVMNLKEELAILYKQVEQKHQLNFSKFICNFFQLNNTKAQFETQQSTVYELKSKISNLQQEIEFANLKNVEQQITIENLEG